MSREGELRDGVGSNQVATPQRWVILDDDEGLPVTLQPASPRSSHSRRIGPFSRTTQTVERASQKARELSLVTRHAEELTDDISVGVDDRVERQGDRIELLLLERLLLDV